MTVSASLFDDRLIRLLAGVTVLLFVGRAVLPRGRGRYPWARWAQWGAIAVFAVAVCFVLGMSLLWVLGAPR